MIQKKIQYLKERLLNHPWLLSLVKLLKGYNPPGFRGNSLFGVGKFFVDSLKQENIHLRASSLAYSFFLSLFPFLLFLLTLIAYIPVDNLKEEFMLNLNKFLPETSFSALQGTVGDILNKQSGGLLSFGLVAAVYFSSNGIMTLISALNRSVPKKDRRVRVKKRGLAIGMTIILIILLIATVGIMVVLAGAETSLLSKSILPVWLVTFLFFIVETLVLMGALLLIISGIYHFAPVKKRDSVKFTFISPGSILATVLIICTTLILQFYINNIFAYNSVYGSIGAIIALLVLLYFNANCILIGYELNRSIDRAINTRLESRPHVIKQID